MSGELPRGVRVGYGLGSVATGAFGTVPGLLLLPYLTDTLGVPALVAGIVVFAPKAWDVLLNPVAGRISDRHVSPIGPRRPFLLRAGVALAVCFALLFAGPPLGSTALDTAYVVLLFLACATAYAFFQVPFVAMPAEMTDSYDERTRLLTWRVVLLALTILVSGATAPAIRNAVGGHDGYRAMGVFVALLILLGTTAAYVGTRRAPIGRVAAAGGESRRAAARRGPAARLPAAADHLRAAGAGDRIDARGRGLRGPQRAARRGRLHLPVRLLRRSRAAAHPGLGGGRRDGSASAPATSRRRCSSPPGPCSSCSPSRSPPPVVYGATGLVGVGYAGAQVFPLSMLADVAAVDAVRSGANRAGVFTGVWTAGETLGLALGPGVFGLVLALGGYVSSTGADVAAARRRPSPRSCSASPCSPGCSCCSASRGWSGSPSRRPTWPTPT